MEARNTRQNEESEVSSSDEAIGHVESALFTFDSKRSSMAAGELSSLCATTTVDRSRYTIKGFRDQCIADYESRRNSDYYNSLQTKLDNHEKLVPAEYFYYAMVTDNVNKLSLAALEEMTKWLSFQNFQPQVNILIAARRWQEASNADAKMQLNNELCTALNDRGFSRNHCAMFLNLHGVNFSGADLGAVSFDYTDLGHANLSKCVLYAAGIHGSNLNDADLSHATCGKATVTSYKYGPYIVDTTARNACFDAFESKHASWPCSDFTGSSFRNATLGDGDHDKTIFDSCDFDGASISIGASGICSPSSFRFANLANTKLEGADYSRLDLTGASLFPAGSFASADAMSAGLDKLNQDIMLEIRNMDTSAWHKTSQIDAYQNVIAKNILYHLNESGLNNGDKVEVMNAALDHDLFLPEQHLQQVAYRTERSIYSLFTSEPHPTYATVAARILEQARDDLLAVESRVVMQ